MEQRFELEHEREEWRTVRGCLHVPEGSAPAPVVLVLHGFKGFMDWGFFPVLARRLVASGIAVVRFNTSGSGIGPDLETFSDPEGFRRDTFSRQLEDIERVRRWLQQEQPPRLDLTRMALVGHSRGGAMALLHASQAKGISAVVTWSAVDRLDRWDELIRALWRREGRLLVHNARTGQDLEVSSEVLEDFEQNAARFDVIAACERLSSPLLAIHGSADEAVDCQALERIAAAAPGSKTLLVPGAGHTFGATHPLRHVGSDLERVLRETEHFLDQELRAS